MIGILDGNVYTKKSVTVSIRTSRIEEEDELSLSCFNCVSSSEARTISNVCEDDDDDDVLEFDDDDDSILSHDDSFVL